VHDGKRWQLVVDRSSAEDYTSAVEVVRPSNATGMGHYSKLGLAPPGTAVEVGLWLQQPREAGRDAPSAVVVLGWDTDVSAGAVAAYTVGDAVAANIRQTVLADWDNIHWQRCSNPSYEFAETYSLGLQSALDAAAGAADAACPRAEKT